MMHFVTSLMMIICLTCIPTALMIGVFTDPYYRNPLVFGILIFTVMIGVFIWQETHTRKK
jgi:hypothetical protein